MRKLLPQLVLSVLLVPCVPARADIFQLTDGGEITGKLVERGPDDEYIIQSDLGANVTLRKDQVKDIVHQSEHQTEYDARSRSLPDTVPAHRALADWCEQKQLKSLAEHHLRRIVELDPNDEQARTSLGYQLHQGKWLTRDAIMAERGMRFYDGQYRTAQEIALLEREKVHKSSEIEWLRQLKLWRGWLESRRPGRAEEAQAEISAITDPQAATSLVRMLDAERDEDLRFMWMEILSQVHHPASMRKLIDLSIDEPDRETRLQCVEYLLGTNDEIDIQPYVKALLSKDNEIVNIAAEALGQIGNRDAISPLIGALVTRHKFAVVPQGELSATFSRDGSGGAGLSAGNKPQFIQQDLENVEVRRALIALSGDQDFGFNERAWSRWYENERSQHQPVIDPRRDQ
jgi:hypothetical protein